MRITSNMYYDSMYSSSNSKLTNELFDVNQQIASGLQIQYAYDDVRTFTETMRLDNEITTIEQVSKSVDSGYKVATQTDSVLNEFQTTLDRTNTLLIQAANGSQSEESLDAIAKELRSLEDHLMNLSNTSIDGKYLFSGSSTDVKPIDANGVYQGNDKSLEAFTGNGISQQYNLTGSDLFLGEENSTSREITTNVVNKNIFDDSTLSGSSEIRDLMGDKNDVSPTTSYFYIRGTKSDGTSFKEKLDYFDTDSIDTLLNDIGDAYGNTPEVDVVNVTMNNMGQIVVEDKMSGSSKLDFHIVGAIDYTGTGAGGLADVDDIDNLDISPANPDLYVKDFMKSGYISADGASSIESTIYDRAEFSKDGSFVTSNTPQVLKDGNAYATPSTKLSEVADTSKGTIDTLSGTSFNFDGIDVNGHAYSASIDLDSAGSTFSVGGNTYEIFDMGDPRAAVDADEMTYQQFMDVMNMVVTDTLPATINSASDYDTAIVNSSYKGSTTLSYDGKLQFEDSNHGTSKATIALYDSVSDDFIANADGSYNSSVMTFNSNNALTISDPKTDFFSTFDDIIKSVENYKTYPDGESGDLRNVGIENSIQMLNDLQSHVGKSQSSVGSQTNALENAQERSQLLELSTMSLRSDTIDTDLAEASLNLTQLNTTYEAMLSTVGKVSQLSLVNYL